MKNFLNALMAKLGYVPAPEVKKAEPMTRLVVNNGEPLTTPVVNQLVRATLRTARDFYAKRGDRIVSVDLQNYLDAFEEILLMSATDGSSVETAKLFGQVPYVLHGAIAHEVPKELVRKKR